MKRKHKTRLVTLFAMFAMIAVGAISSFTSKAVSQTSAATTPGTLWKRVTKLDDLTEGKYVFMGGTNAKFVMAAARGGAYQNKVDLTTAGTTTDLGSNVIDDQTIVWELNGSGANYTINSVKDGTNGYLYYTGSKNEVAYGTTARTWTFSFANDLFTISDDGTPDRLLQYNPSSPRFACYTTDQTKISLYKYEEGTPDPGKTLSSIAVTKQPDTKTYFVGDTFDKTGMVVMATYSTGSPEDVTDFVIVTPDPLTEGLTSVTVSYTYGLDTKTTTVSGLTVTVPSFSTVKYSIVSKNTLTKSGDAPENSDVSLVETYGTSKQITSGNSQTLTLTGYTNVKIIEITMSMRSNKSTGAGSFKYSVNDGATYHNIVAGAAFNTASWNGAWSTAYVDVTHVVDIAVQSDIEFIVAATANSLYVESYEFKWEQEEAAVLTGLTMNKTTVSIVEEETEQLAVTPVPELAPYDVTWTSNNTAAATVDQNGLVTAVAAGKGTATITATDKTNTSIKATSVVTVLPMPDYDYFGKITDTSKLHFGATYVIANEDGTKAMSNEYPGGNNIPAQDTVLKNGEIRGQDVLMKVVLEIGLVEGTYALKTVSTHGASDGKYIYAAGASSANNLKLQDEITVNSSWLITFDDGVAALVAQNEQSRNVMRFNSTNSPNIFSAYSGGQDDVALFLHEDSVNAMTSATMVANEINEGKGHEAKGRCAEVLPLLMSAYDRLSPEAKVIFNTSTEKVFVDARNRLAYIEAWVAANPEGGEGSALNVTPSQSMSIIVIISILGISTLAGYYFIRRKPAIEIK